MAPPSTIKAITINGNKAQVSEINLPKVRPTYLLAKVEAIALNPTDWKHINGKRAADNGLSGCDFSGTVVEVGSDVTKQFQTDVSQTTFPLGVSTVGQGLYQKALKLNLPTDPIPKDSQTVLIYGGSTATGSLAIQFAKLSGYKVLTTCSPHNNDFVQSLGADAVYNYRDADCGKQINRDTNDSLKLIWDTISLEASAKVCAEALSSDAKDARYGTILPVKLPGRTDVTTTFTFMYTIFNEAFEKAGRNNPAVPEDFEFAKKFFQITEDLLKEGRLKTHPEQVGGEGLAGALKGLEDLKNDQASGKKFVYRVADTPANAVGSASVEL
ncbi:hypothetical protein BST61_g2543 [Cercospora zeina]